MFNLESFGKILLSAGIILVLAGVFLIYFKHIPFIGKLPGDILIQKKNFTFYFPLTTSIFLSIVLSAILYFFARK